MPIFKRAPKPPPALDVDLPAGEEYERGAQATLIQGKASMRGALYMTNRRLMFHAQKGDARWLVVPFDEVKSAGIYPAPRVTMGAPGASAQSLFVETTKGEHVWWSFDRTLEDEWLPLVRERADAAAKTRDEKED